MQSAAKTRSLLAATPVLGLIAAGLVGFVVSTPGCGSPIPHLNLGASQPGAVTTWTVLMYSVGRNENSPGTLAAVNGFSNRSVQPALNFEANFSSINLQAASLPFTTTQRITVSKNGNLGVFADLGQTNMADGNELVAYLTDGVRLGGQRNHVLILQGHGGTPNRGFSSDVAAVTTLDLATLDTNLQVARGNVNLAKFAIVVLDAPQGSTIETISVNRKPADFLVAHEASAPGTTSSAGFDYGAIIDSINNNSNIAPNLLAASIAQNAANVLSSTAANQAPGTIVAALNLANGGALETAINTLGQSLAADIAVTGTAGTAAAIAVGTARRDCAEMEPILGTQIVDIFDFASRIASLNSGTTVGGLSATSVNAAGAVTSAVAGMISVASVGSSYSSPLNARGIGIFFPANNKVADANYDSRAAAFKAVAPNWFSFLTMFHNALASSQTAPVVAVNVTPAVIPVNLGSTFTVAGTIANGNTIRDVTVILAQSFGAPVNLTNAVQIKQHLGPPDPTTGAYTITLPALTATLVGIGSGSVATVPINRNSSGAGGEVAISADLRYTSGGQDVFRFGYLRLTGGVAVVGSRSPISWTSIGSNNCIGRNDNLTSSGVNYLLLPRVLTVTAGNKLMSNPVGSGSTTGTIPLVSNGVQSISVSIGGLTPGPATIFVFAENMNGDIGVGSMPVTLQ